MKLLLLILSTFNNPIQMVITFISMNECSQEYIYQNVLWLSGRIIDYKVITDKNNYLIAFLMFVKTTCSSPRNQI